jgi:transcriptional regulator with XRE-family HTH domain
MSGVKILVAAGAPLALAVRAALGMSQREIADAYGIGETTLSALLAGSARYPYERTRNVLAGALGVERGWLDQQIDHAGQRHCHAA